MAVFFPTLMTEFIQVLGVQWVTTGYLLAIAIVVRHLAEAVAIFLATNLLFISSGLNYFTKLNDFITRTLYTGISCTSLMFHIVLTFLHGTVIGIRRSRHERLVVLSQYVGWRAIFTHCHSNFLFSDRALITGGGCHGVALGLQLTIGD